MYYGKFRRIWHYLMHKMHIFHNFPHIIHDSAKECKTQRAKFHIFLKNLSLQYMKKGGCCVFSIPRDYGIFSAKGSVSGDSPALFRL